MTRRGLRLCAIAAAIVPALASGRAQQPTFTSRIEGVRVDVLVTERGKPVAGLRREDFEVRDNGVLQEVDVVSFGQVPLSLVLALDHSDSVIGERLDQLRRAGATLLDGLQPADQAALLTFSDRVAQASPLTRDFDALRTALVNTQTGGLTALIDATYAAMILGEADVGRALVIVFSDGLDTASWLRPEQVAAIARQADVVVYAVATGRQEPEFLRTIASATGGFVLRANNTAQVRTMFLKILEEFRQRYLVTYTPRGVDKGGWHRLEVRVKRQNVRVSARPGYEGGTSNLG